MAASFTPPHPTPGMWRVLKQAYRDYLAGGNAAFINVTTPPTHTAASTTTVAGTVEVAVPGTMPATVTAILTQASTTKGTQSAAVDPVTGAYTTTFAGALCVAGTATATVSCTSPLETTTTPAFTLT
jgi:hypothetical protein